MKGCFAPPEFPRALLPTVFQRVAALSADEKYNVVLLFEHMPLGKANSVADEATAYRRNLTSNVLAVVYSQEESDEVFKYSRDACHEICGLITSKAVDNVGYGNYSEGLTHLLWEALLKNRNLRRPRQRGPLRWGICRRLQSRGELWR